MSAGSARSWLHSTAVALIYAVSILGAPLLVTPELWPAGFQPLIVVVALVGLAGVALRSTNGTPHALLACFGVVAVVSWLQADDLDRAFSHFTALAYGLVLASGLSVWARTRARLSAAVLAGLAMTLTMLTVGLFATRVNKLDVMPWEFTRDWPTFKVMLPRVPNGQVNPNALAGTAISLVPFAVVVAVARRSATGMLSRAIAVLVTVVTVLIVGIAQSRAAWCAGILTFAVALCLSRSRRVKTLALAALVVAGVASAAGVYYSEKVNAATLLASTRTSMQDRAFIWSQALSHIQDAPWGGIGLNEFRYVYTPPDHMPRTHDIAHAHNMLLQTALDTGIPGLLVYVALMIALLRLASRTLRQGNAVAALVASGSGLCLLAFHAFGTVDAIALGSKVGVFQWAVSGLILGAHEMRAPAADPDVHGARAETNS